jgi:hypothetical protein
VHMSDVSNDRALATSAPDPKRWLALAVPDGHVAWVGDRTDPGLHHALTTWFGPPVFSRARQ